MNPPDISVIIPVLNDARALKSSLAHLRSLREQGTEVIVCDGGSEDDSLAVARAGGARVVVSAPGRGRQMNAGAAVASGELLLFLHADTRLPEAARTLLIGNMVRGESAWGWFHVRLSGRHPLLRWVEFLMNLRARITRVATGDQAIFLTRSLFQSVGGFPEIPLMEDVAMCKRLRRAASPVCIRTPVVTSSRRWEDKGILRTILLMWRLRLAYTLGISPQRLAGLYYRQ